MTPYHVNWNKYAVIGLKFESNCRCCIVTIFKNNCFLIKKQITSSSDLLSYKSLFGGQL